MPVAGLSRTVPSRLSDVVSGEALGAPPPSRLDVSLAGRDDGPAGPSARQVFVVVFAQVVAVVVLPAKGAVRGRRAGPVAAAVVAVVQVGLRAVDLLHVALKVGRAAEHAVAARVEADESPVSPLVAACCCFSWSAPELSRYILELFFPLVEQPDYIPEASSAGVVYLHDQARIVLGRFNVILQAPIRTVLPKRMKPVVRPEVVFPMLELVAAWNRPAAYIFCQSLASWAASIREASMGFRV